MPDSSFVVRMYSTFNYFGLCLLILFSADHLPVESVATSHSLTILMPNVRSQKPDDLICTQQKLSPVESYIVRFTPHASKETAHHLMVFGCKEPANQNRAWTCDQADEWESPNSVCGNGERREILFAWALNAPAKSLPEGVGLRISGSTSIKYIVVQVHYTRLFEEGKFDNSGVTLEVTRERPPLQLGYYVLGSIEPIPPGQKFHHLNTACRYDDDHPMTAIAFRTHSHSLGVVTTGYRVRNRKWTQIGRMSPQKPQAFYPVAGDGIDIQKGDILAARCTMDSMSRNETTIMGPTHADEMCNFYIMYTTSQQEDLHTRMCFPPQPEQFREPNGLLDFPQDASSMEGIPGAEEILEKFSRLDEGRST